MRIQYLSLLNGGNPSSFNHAQYGYRKQRSERRDYDEFFFYSRSGRPNKSNKQEVKNTHWKDTSAFFLGWSCDSFQCILTTNLLNFPPLNFKSSTSLVNNN